MADKLRCWCLHCETAFSAEQPPEMCPKCGAGCFDVFQIGYGLLNPIPEHWPEEIEDGKVYTLYE